METSRAGRPTGELFGHPKGLAILFLTETWEKFSFFGMRSILVYYMVRGLGFDPAKASLVYGLYTGFVYFTLIFGGWISDRWLGRRKSILVGGTIMALGHFLLAFDLLYIALICVVVGNGFYLPSLPSQIRDLYSPDDPRLSRASSIYYLGINLGAFVAPFVVGTLGELWGWHYGFGAAGAGMMIGLATYVAGSRFLPPETAPARARPVARRTGADLGRLRLHPRLGSLVAIMLAVAVFRASYEQVGNSVALWIEAADRSFGPLVIPASWFQALNPMLVLFGTVPMIRWFNRLQRRGREPSTMHKMALGAALTALSYFLVAAVNLGGHSSHWLWVVTFICVYTFAELLILPVGLGLFIRVAPPGYAGSTVALWFFASFLGNLIGGVLGGFWTSMPPSAFFVIVGLVALAAAAALVPLDRRVRRLEAEAEADVAA
jgi:POT family proton-dependent oligopeptide transporter